MYRGAMYRKPKVGAERHGAGRTGSRATLGGASVVHLVVALGALDNGRHPAVPSPPS